TSSKARRVPTTSTLREMSLRDTSATFTSTGLASPLPLPAPVSPRAPLWEQPARARLNEIRQAACKACKRRNLFIFPYFKLGLLVTHHSREPQPQRYAPIAAR